MKLNAFVFPFTVRVAVPFTVTGVCAAPLRLHGREVVGMAKRAALLRPKKTILRKA